MPVMGTGATDGLFLRNAGMPVYGVTGIVFPGFLVWISVSTSNISSIVPKPPGKTTSALAG